MEHNKIDGLDRLLKTFPKNKHLTGAYLKGVLLHENGDVQLTYSIESDKTYIIVFVIIGCEQTINLNISTGKTSISGVEMSFDGKDQNVVYFVDNTNHINLCCQDIKITTNIILSKRFAKEQSRKLTQEYSELLQNKFNGIERLMLSDGRPLFRRDDSYNGIYASHHTMYKLTDLQKKDGSIVYEFLIEFDRNDPCVGIYYGCKGLIKHGDNEEQQKLLIEEWEKTLKPKVLKRLNTLFPNKKFDNRFKPTDNANDNTFWPFWISLHEDENLIEVAVRATILIRNEYKRYLEGADYEADEICRYILKNTLIDKSEVHSDSCFTEESWENLRHPWKSNYKHQAHITELENEEWSTLLDKFIAGAKRIGLITEGVDGYEKAFMFKGSRTCLSVMLKLLVNRMHSPKKVPWSLVCRQFLSNSEIYNEDSLKNMCRTFFRNKLPSFNEKDNYENRMKWEKRESHEYVRKFREIMHS